MQSEDEEMGVKTVFKRLASFKLGQSLRKQTTAMEDSKVQILSRIENVIARSIPYLARHAGGCNANFQIDEIKVDVASPSQIKRQHRAIRKCKEEEYTSEMLDNRGVLLLLIVVACTYPIGL